MRRGTLWYCVALVLAVTGLVVSIKKASSPRQTGQVREFLFACWGSATEVKELRQFVIDPINRRSDRFHISLAVIPRDYDVKLYTMIAGGTPPDLFYLGQALVPSFAAQGALLDLTDFIASDQTEVTDLSGYYANILQLYRYQDRMYGLPWISQPVIVYCNARLFREASVPLPDNTWNWNRFVEVAKALTRDTDADGRIDQWGFVLHGWPPFQIWLWQNGVDIVDHQSGKLNLDDPKVIEAIDFYGGLIHQHHVAPPLSIVNEMGLSDMFRAEKVAMFMGGAADELDRLPGVEVVTVELPMGPTGIRSTYAWTAGLHISRSVRDPALAFEVWKELLDGIQHWKIPAPRRALAARLEEFEPRKTRAAPVIKASMEYMRTPVVFENHAEWQTLFREEFLDKLLREGTPAKELAQLCGPSLEELF